MPAVVNTAPDLTLLLKKPAGKSFLLSNGLAPAPSQLISRRPAGCSPAVPPFDAPSRFRKSSTLVAMFPVAVSTVACGGSGAGGTLVTESLLQAVITATAASAINLILCICVSFLGEPFVQRPCASRGTPLRQPAALSRALADGRTVRAERAMGDRTKGVQWVRQSRSSL